MSDDAVREAASVWCGYAADDLRGAEDLLGVPEPRWGLVCYHCQQAAEKYLKAYLTSRQTDFRPVHQMEYLTQRCMESDETFAEMLGAAVSLQPYASDVRYPYGLYEPPTPKEAAAAVACARQIRDFVLGRM
jgi:HEPN domain-containing protein